MESEEEKIAWRNFVQATIAHNGHGSEGQGSPITQLVLVHYEAAFKKIWDGEHSDSHARPTQKVTGEAH